MVGVLTPRSRLALLMVAALAALSGVLVMGAVQQDEPPLASRVLVGATDEVGTLVATPARSASVPVALRSALAPVTVVAAAGAVRVTRSRRHRWAQGLRARLGDVGDAWRALLLGAPPASL